MWTTYIQHTRMTTLANMVTEGASDPATAATMTNTFESIHTGTRRYDKARTDKLRATMSGCTLMQ